MIELAVLTRIRKSVWNSAWIAGLSLLLCVSPGWAGSLANAKNDLGGWRLSNVEVAKESPEQRIVRLERRVDRGNASLNSELKLEPGKTYALEVEYRSTNEVSARDKGSWIYVAFKDGQGKNLTEVAQPLEKSASWRAQSISLKPPAGAEKIFLSIRQQQSKGTFDLKKIELRPENSDAVLSLSPNVLATMERLLTPGEKLSPEGERSPRDGNIFAPYLHGKAPPIVRDLGTATVEGVSVQKVVFRSMTVGGEPQDVFAVIARPLAEGNYPGILWLHGGDGSADVPQAVRYAKAGYVAVSPDLPGIADAKKCPDSVGPWTERLGALSREQPTVRPDPTANPIFDAEVAALQSFDLLAAQPGVLKDRIGVAGISMGGYSTTMLAGLLGNRVRAAYSKFGSGFYDRGSNWSSLLADQAEDERQIWLQNFDAGRRAPGIQAPYFLAAAASDHFFWPPAVNATLSAIPGKRNQVYAPANHRLTGLPGEEKIDLHYLNYWLKGEGQPFPEVTVEGCESQPDGSKQVTFSAQAPLPVETATLYVTAGGETWDKSTWEPIPAEKVGEKFQVVIPAGKVTSKGAWFVNVSDARPATAGSFVYGMDASGSGPTLRPLGVDSPKSP